MSRSDDILKAIREEQHIPPDAMFIINFKIDGWEHGVGHALNPWIYFRDNLQVFDNVVAGRTMRRNNCFANSATMLLRSRLQYCEGWLYLDSTIISVDHAWNYDRSKNIAIDHTISDLTDKLHVGTRLPDFWVEKAIRHDMWIHSIGVLNTMAHFSNEELDECQQHIR